MKMSEILMKLTVAVFIILPGICAAVVTVILTTLCCPGMVLKSNYILSEKQFKLKG